MKYLSLLSFFVLTVISFQLKATHLLGGNIAYEYLGADGNGNYQYQVTIYTYINCEASSQVQDPEAQITYGIYTHDNSNPLADKVLYEQRTVNLFSNTEITPEVSDTCSTGTSACIREGVYIDNITVPFNLSGYHLVYNRCCRNGEILNLLDPGSQGMVFYSYIPSTLIDNSSPNFNDKPIPFICASDTTTLLNSAVDPDGDQLIFSFVNPYNGEADQNNPAPLPPNNLNWPIQDVTWAANHNLNQPFGPNGYAFINAATGLTEYYPVTTGRFVVAVEVREYRNNQLIGITRRDMQLLSLDCPANPAPELSSTVNNGATVFHIIEGETLCFDVQFNDANTDSVELAFQGEIFDNSVVDPIATVTPGIGDGTATSNVCWASECGDARGLPYMFDVTASDNGCPPKSNSVIYQIFVDPFVGPTEITGDTIVCVNSPETYSIPSFSGSYYLWEVYGGTQLTGDSTSNSISVEWTNIGLDSIGVTVVNGDGCAAGPIYQHIYNNALPTPDAGANTTICWGDTVQLSASGGDSYAWSPVDSLSDPTVFNPFAFPSDTMIYVVTVTDTNGCVAPDTVQVNVTPLPTVLTGNDTTLCSGNTVALGDTAITNYVYAWSPGSGLSDASVSNPTLTLLNDTFPNDTLYYTLTVTDTITGCINQDSVQVVVFPYPFVDAGLSVAFCSEDSALIGTDSIAGFVYNWNTSFGLTDSTSYQTYVSLVNADEVHDSSYYYLTASFQGCMSTDSVLVVTYGVPIVDAGPNSDLCIYDSLQLTATGGDFYEWSPNFSLTDTSIFNPITFTQVDTMYYVLVTDSNGCQNIDSVFINVNPLPIVSTGPDTSFCSGMTVEIGDTAFADHSYVWSPVLGLDNINASNPNLTLTDLNFPNDTSYYTLTVTIDSTGCTDSDSVQVVVFPYPQSMAGSDVAFCSGDSAIIGNDSLSVISGYTFDWNPDTGIVDTTGYWTYVSLMNLDEIHDTSNYVLTTTYQGCATNDTVQVVVYGVPLIDAGVDTMLCIGDTIGLMASNGVSYTWWPNVNMNDSTLVNPNVWPDTTQLYFVEGIDGFGCPNTDSVNVVVNLLPTPDTGGDQYLCPGSSMQLAATGGETYTWTPSYGMSDTTIFDPVIDPMVTTTYYLTVVDSNGCVNSDTMLVEVLPTVPTEAGDSLEICIYDSTLVGGNPTSPMGTIYAWYPEVMMDDSTLSNPQVYPINSMWYYVETSNDTCRGMDSVWVTVHELPNADAGIDQAICYGTSTFLNASGGELYAWSPSADLSDSTLFNPEASPLSTTDYIVWVTDSNNCVQSDTMNLEIYDLPDADAGEDVEICLGDTIGLEASGGVAYEWSPNTALSDDMVADPDANPSSTQTYTVLVTDANNCEQTDDVMVTVHALPVVTTSSDTTICEGGTASLWAAGGEQYAWSPVSDLSTPTAANTDASPMTTITYTVLVTDSNSCMNTSDVMVTVNEEPVANYSVVYVPGCEGVTGTFTNESEQALTYQWNFGDGATSNEQNPVHVFSYDGMGNITLTAINNMCADSMITNLTAGSIAENVDEMVRNVISPNGDGINDCFEITIEGDFEDCVEIEIFDRWGLKMYNSNEHDWCWEGINEYNNQPVSDGTYYYVITVAGQVKFKSFVTVLRN